MFLLRAVTAPAKFVVNVLDGKNVVESVGALAADIAAPAATLVTAPVKLGLDIAKGRNVLEAAGAAVTDTLLGGPRLPGQRILIHDASDGRGFLGVTWDVAGVLTEVSDRFDCVIRATSWADVAERLWAIAQSGGPIGEVQYWGHGCPGAAFIGEDALRIGNLSEERWTRLGGCFCGPDAVFWLRTCSSLNRDAGRAFAEALGNCLRCRIAGHTQDIAAKHGGLVIRRLGERASWGDGDGAWCLASDLGHHDIGN